MQIPLGPYQCGTSFDQVRLLSETNKKVVVWTLQLTRILSQQKFSRRPVRRKYIPHVAQSIETSSDLTEHLLIRLFTVDEHVVYTPRAVKVAILKLRSKLLIAPRVRVWTSDASQPSTICRDHGPSLPVSSTRIFGNTAIVDAGLISSP